MKKKIYFIEDEQSLHEILNKYAEIEGLELVSIFDGGEALKRIEEITSENGVIILDLMLPQVSGLEILKEVRRRSNQPVIILTAMGDEGDRLLGLELGADDYVVKPFSPREVIARVKAVLRRLESVEVSPQPTKRELLGGYIIDREEMRVYWNEKPIPFTAAELKIIFKLAESPKRVFMRSELVKVISDEYEVDERVIDAHVKNIRKKTYSAGSPDLIETVRGFGYRLNQELLT
jgi:DNA-binding response OmpR family regulator